MQKKNIVVMGGGTGTHTVLRGLKRYQDTVRLSAVVTMADSGGSTGRLRDEFGYLPVGDVRMALTALASDVDDHEELLRELFLYRFEKGDGLSGHNFGNLLLVALTDILGSEEAAITAAAKVLRVQGSVVPVTTEKVDLVATYDDGIQVIGEHDIDEPTADRGEHEIVELSISPVANMSDKAEQAIHEADLIILGPGDLYTSVLANCVVGGVAEALAQVSVPIVYISNLMTKLGQTDGKGVQEHFDELTRYIGKAPSHVLINSTELPKELLERYKADKEFPVEDNIKDDACTVIRTDLLTSEGVRSVQGDLLKRSLIRHDSDKLATEILKLI